MPKINHYGTGIGVVKLSNTSKDLWREYDNDVTLEGPANKLIIRSTHHAGELVASLNGVIAKLIDLWNREYAGRKGRKPGSGLLDVRTTLGLLIDDAPQERELTSRDLYCATGETPPSGTPTASSKPDDPVDDGVRVESTAWEVHQKLVCYVMDGERVTLEVAEELELTVPIPLQRMTYTDGTVAYRFVDIKGIPYDSDPMPDSRRALHNFAEKLISERTALEGEALPTDSFDHEVMWLLGYEMPTPSSFAYVEENNHTGEAVTDEA